MWNGFKLLIKFLKKTYILSVWYNRMSLLSCKICTEDTLQTDADQYSASIITLAQGNMWVLLWYYISWIWQGYWTLSEIYIIYQCKIIVIKNYHGYYSPRTTTCHTNTLATLHLRHLKIVLFIRYFNWTISII